MCVSMPRSEETFCTQNSSGDECFWFKASWAHGGKKRSWTRPVVRIIMHCLWQFACKWYLLSTNVNASKCEVGIVVLSPQCKDNFTTHVYQWTIQIFSLKKYGDVIPSRTLLVLIFCGNTFLVTKFERSLNEAENFYLNFINMWISWTVIKYLVSLFLPNSWKHSCLLFYLHQSSIVVFHQKFFLHCLIFTSPRRFLFLVTHLQTSYQHPSFVTHYQKCHLQWGLISNWFARYFNHLLVEAANTCFIFCIAPTDRLFNALILLILDFLSMQVLYFWTQVHFLIYECIIWPENHSSFNTFKGRQHLVNFKIIIVFMGQLFVLAEMHAVR